MQLLVNIDVPDLASAEAFYCAAFGLRVGRRLGDGVVELLGGNAPIYLLHKPAGTTAAANAARDYNRHWTPVHCDIVVDDLDTALARAVTAGALQEGSTHDADYGRIAQLADPFGHGWCLIQFNEAGYDAIA